MPILYVYIAVADHSVCLPTVHFAFICRRCVCEYLECSAHNPNKAPTTLTSLRQTRGCGIVRLHGTFDGNMINNDKQKIIKSSKVNQLHAEGTYPIGNRHVVVCI